VSKILYIWDDDGPYGQPVMYLDAQSDAPTGMPFRPQMNLQNNISSAYVDYSPNVPGQTGYTFARDTWVKWEFYLRHNTPGMSDGVIRVWMNGIKTHEYTDVQMAGTEMFTTQRHWVTMQFAPYWGGTGSSVSSLQYLYMDHLYGCAD
jgi:hypothetical protein